MSFLFRAKHPPEDVTTQLGTHHRKVRRTPGDHQKRSLLTRRNRSERCAWGHGAPDKDRDNWPGSAQVLCATVLCSSAYRPPNK